MAKLKTHQTTQDVNAYIESIAHEQKRKDGFVILNLMKHICQMEAKMWGPSIIGFGSYHYKYESGHEGDAPLLGFSPRKSSLVLYVLNNFENQKILLSKLGKHKTGKVCLYINKLADVNMDILTQIIQASWDKEQKKYL